MKTVDKIMCDYGMSWGYEVYQNISAYNPTLNFGPCQTTLEELFDRGFHIYCHVRKNCRQDNFRVPLYLTDGKFQYKIGTIDRQTALMDGNDLGVFVDRLRGDMETRGSVDISKYRIKGDMAQNALYKLEEFFVDLLGEEACMRGAVDSDKFTSVNYFDWELVKDAILIRFNNMDKSSSPECNVMEALKSVLEAYPKPMKKKPVTMIGNQTLPEYVLNMVSGI